MRGVAIVTCLLAFACDEIDHEPGFGASCDEDEDCDTDLVCGVNGDGDRACVPEVECDVDASPASCAGDFIAFCSSATSTISFFDCRDFFVDLSQDENTCGDAPCSGACDTPLGPFCLAGGASETCRDPLALIFGGGFLLCPDGDQACTLDNDGETCKPSPLQCLPDTSAAQCSGNSLALCFPVNASAFESPTVIDCNRFNGTCDAAQNACIAAAGAQCDGNLIKCADGLTCNGFNVEEFVFGTCG